ncbi:MAG: hypothetical protein AAGC80_01860 [Rhodococcus sp. (in: high G+C Gram-positive bacteria)]
MNDEIIDEFLEFECDDTTRDLLRGIIDEVPSNSTRTVTLNAFNIVIYMKRNEVVIEDELDVERSTGLPLARMRAILTRITHLDVRACQNHLPCTDNSNYPRRMK